jgi:transcriptional regulator with XRE-family HTH domain
MEIKDRIVKIISSEGITSSSFADIIGVQRSSISHILSGRNNPGLEILQKILTGFPKYNAEWLIIGKGEIYKKPTQANLFDAIDAADNKSKPVENITKNSDSFPVNEIPAAKTSDSRETQSSFIPAAIKSMDINDPEIEKIALFYSDGTFKIYRPT